MRRKARDFAALLVQCIDGAERVRNDFWDAREAALNRRVRDIGQPLLDRIQHIGRVFILVRGKLHPVVEDAEHLPQQRLVLEDADVAFDVDVAWHALGERREIGWPTDGIELAPLRERVHHGDVVDRMACVQ